MTIELRDAGMATSGRARRGYRIGGRWYSHVIDPRTGRTVDDVASVTVVASSAATADVLATLLGVLHPTRRSPRPIAGSRVPPHRRRRHPPPEHHLGRAARSPT